MGIIDIGMQYATRNVHFLASLVETYISGMVCVKSPARWIDSRYPIKLRWFRVF